MRDLTYYQTQIERLTEMLEAVVARGERQKHEITLLQEQARWLSAKIDELQKLIEVRNGTV